MQPHTDETKKEFSEKVANGMPQGQAYQEVTGVAEASASVSASRWMRMPDIQEYIQRESQKNLLKAGTLAIDKLTAGLEAIETTKITPTGVKLITLGLQMSGVLDRRIELKLPDSPDLDPEVLAALKVLGNQAMTSVQDLQLNADGVYEIMEDQEPSAEPS